MSEQKPRELWIHTDDTRDIDNGWFHKVDIASRNMWDSGQVLHLVEASALDAAKAEIKKLKEVISYLPKVPTMPYEKEMAREIEMLKIKLGLMTENELVLKDKIERLKETLSYYPKIRF
jgi:hypothetical protein